MQTTDFAQTEVGQQLQSAELAKQARKAAGALLAVAILQCLFGLILLAVGGSAIKANPDVELHPAVFATIFAIGAIFFGLYLWARKNPLPAAITGLVLFISVHALDALADPTAIVRGLLVKIIIVVVLARAIAAGARHRRLARAARPVSG